MKIFTLIFLALISSYSNSENAEQPKIIKEQISQNSVNYRVEGSLEKSNELPCIGLDQAKNTYTPADLYPSAAKCMLEGKDEESAELFFLAAAYAVYDSFRVADRTAGGARQVLIMKHIKPIAPESKKGFMVEVKKISNGKSEESLEFCYKIKELGKPDYHPQYMILHGLAAFSGEVQGNGLVKDYDPDENWSKALAALKWCSE